MFDLFLRRGEDINGQCGPGGTAIKSLSQLPDIYREEMLDMLVRKGASVHVSGPNGNTLECVWKIANEQQISKPYTYATSYIGPIHRLIELGAVKRRRELNGIGPHRLAYAGLFPKR
jgi:hypothetical protein